MRLLETLASLALISLAGYAAWFYLSTGGNLPFGFQDFNEGGGAINSTYEFNGLSPEPVDGRSFDEEAFKRGVVHIVKGTGLLCLGSSFGTGFIVDRFQGWVVTAQHVVDGGCGQSVGLVDGRLFGATRIAEDAVLDLAMLELSEVRSLDELPLGSSGTLQVADQLCTAAYVKGRLSPPFMTCGTFLGRGQCGEIDGLFFDADVLAGHSGGPLINGRGEVVGVVTRSSEAYFRGTESCATPIEVLAQLVPSGP